MYIMRNLVTGPKGQDRWFLLILITTVLVFSSCWYAITQNIHTVIPHLFYIPVILACWRFPRPGVLFTFGIVSGYAGLELFYSPQMILDPDVIFRCLIIIFIGMVVAYLSLYLHNREKSYLRLLTALDTGVILTDRSGRILYSNPYAIKVLDRKAGSLSGSSLLDYAGNETDLKEFLEKCQQNGQSDTTKELVLKRNDGFPVPVLLSGYLQKEEELILTLNDLSEEKWLAHELANDRRVMTTLIDAIPEGIFLSDNIGTIIGINRSCVELTGWNEGTSLSEKTPGPFFGELSGNIQNALRQAVREKQPVTINLETLSGESRRHYEVSLTPVYDSLNSVNRVAGVIHDITSRENYLKQVREREEYLRMVLDGLPFATVVINPDHEVLSVNQALSMLFEREVDDLIGTTGHGHLLYPAGERPMLSDLMIEDEVDILLNEWYGDLYLPSPTVPGAYEVIDFFPHIGEGGKWIKSTSSRLVDEKGATIGAIETFEDFTSLKATEETIRISEERFKIASQIATDLIFEYDQETDQILWFGGVEKWLGLESSERVSTMTSWTNLIHEEDVGKVKSAFIHHVLTGEPIKEELRIKHRSGLYQTWVIKAVALYNTNFRQIKTVGIVSDVSEIRANEEAKRKALITIEKYIEQFAILNDHIRNPLQVIAGYNDLQGGEYAREIASQIAQVNRIVDQLDKGWIESESIRDFLRRHYGIKIKD